MKTFAEKILGAKKGTIVFKKPDIVLSHDNSASIKNTFVKMGGKNIADPDQILITLDHNAPPTEAKLANDYQIIREFVKTQGIKKFHDVGDGICHQLMARYAKSGMLIVGSDSHTCTAGAFNAFATGIDRTETAGLWMQGETWFRVPESIKITLSGKLNNGVYAKDIALWLVGMLGSEGADYMSVEFHGDAVKSLSISDRMTIANLCSEMGAKNAVFPADEVLSDYYGKKITGIWADDDAEYLKSYEIDLSKIFPVVSAPHHVDNVKAVSEVQGTKIQQAVIGTCTNGRIEDIRITTEILAGQKIPNGLQLLVIPASKEIYLQALKEGLVEKLLIAGANFLSPSCGPCLGTGQGIPADNYNVISTANRNFKGRMGNKNANIYLASPATVAVSALKGEITDPRDIHRKAPDKYPYPKKQTTTVTIAKNENRYYNGVWNYADADNLNTDQMFAGNLTYNIDSSDAEKILPHLFKGFDENFAENVKKDDIIIAGSNFGCGSSREHPSVGLAYAGVKAVIVKSVNRIFYRSSVNQGLPIIILPQAVEAFKQGNHVSVDFGNAVVKIQEREFKFSPLPEKLMEIFKQKGLVHSVK